MNPLSIFWQQLIDSLFFAFHPIVNIHTGAVYGFEALLRGHRTGGFDTIHNLFDAAFADGVLYSLDYRLREKALSQFVALPAAENAKLFYNLDNRVTETLDYSPGNTLRLLDRAGLDPSSVVFEVSERHRFSDYEAAQRVLESYKGQNFRIAIDDFGAGYAGLQLLYFSKPDLIKIDRFFVEGIDGDPRKRLFVERIVDLAHLMGIQVAAEGVETEREFLACRRIGCDLAQGYLVSQPVSEAALLKDRYPLVSELARRERRGVASEALSIRARIDPVFPVSIGQDMLSVLDRFRDGDPGTGAPPAAIPVVDAKGACAGILRERDFRSYVYSPFGISLLRHAAAAAPLGGLIVPVPVVDVNADLRTVQSLFVGSPEADGIVVSEDGAYLGFLDARSILEAMTERELSEARDQNPLSRLPGNAKLDEYLAERWEAEDADCLFCYFDFNDFKPYNDRYGFRRGDRVIQLFADILRDVAGRLGWFAAHIGGDDFFAGMDCPSTEAEALCRGGIDEVVSRFAQSVVSFYDEADRTRGGIEGIDRSGTARKFPLLTVVAATHRRLPGPPPVSLDGAGEYFAALKAEAKGRRALSSLAVASLAPNPHLR